MGMGFVRWLFRSTLWPRRAKEEDEEDPPQRGKGRGKGSKDSKKAHHPGVYRIEVDSEMGRFHGDGPPFSFWSSSRIILILSFLLWWIQPAGPMIAGYVGGRRAGSPIKAVIAALLPIFAIFIANAAYSHSIAARQIDFVASLPMIVSDALASIVPFLGPYKEFMIAYMRGFVEALGTTFGMGTNGYLMVIIFAYIGGLIADQTRRELRYRAGAGSSLGVNLVQPIFGARAHLEDEDEDDEDEDEAPRHRRHPVRARAHGRPVPVGLEKRRHGRRDRTLDHYRKVPAEVLDADGGRRSTRSRRRDEDEEDDEDESETVVVAHTKRLPKGHAEERRERRHPARARREDEDEEEDEEPERPEPQERHPVRARSHDEERAIQRFVERALRNYDHSKL